MGEKIELLETIHSFAQGAKADLMKAAVKENQLWQAITRYQDIVRDDVATLRDIGDQADDAKKTKHEKEARKKQRLAIENAYSSEGGYESSASSAISTHASSSSTPTKAVLPPHTPPRPVHKTVLSNTKVSTPPS